MTSPPVAQSRSAPLPAEQTFDIRPLLFAAAAGSMSMMAFAAVIAPMARLLGLEPWHVGTAITAAGVAWMVMSRFWGVRSDRLGRRNVLLVGLTGFAVSYVILGLFMNAALAWAPAAVISFIGMTLGRMVAGAFYAAVPPVCAAIVADNTPPQHRARAMGTLGAASAVGMMVGPGSAGLLAGWNLGLSLLLISVLPVVALAVAWRMLPKDTPHISLKKTTLKLTDSRIRRVVFTSFAAMCSVVLCQVVVGFLAMDRFGLTPNEAARVSGIALAVVGVVLFCSQMVLRRLSWSPSRFIRIGSLVTAAGFVATVFVPSPLYLWLSYGVIAAGMGWIYPSLSALAANSVEAHEQGSAAGSVASAQGLGTIAAPIIGTVVYQWSSGAPFALSALLILAAALWPSAKADAA